MLSRGRYQGALSNCSIVSVQKLFKPDATFISVLNLILYESNVRFYLLYTDKLHFLSSLLILIFIAVHISTHHGTSTTAKRHPFSRLCRGKPFHACPLTFSCYLHLLPLIRPHACAGISSTTTFFTLPFQTLVHLVYRTCYV